MLLIPFIKKKNVCVLGIPDNYWGTIVCAVIQWQGNYKLSKMELREYCNNFMEKYKFPKKIFEIEEFPLTRVCRHEI
ncbi:MAG TPA: hypothetical protein LFW13_01340 [Rickettsia endosymbiont of Sericostoma sp.]|uniref:AMP-binding enzyme n=1 Tax=Candidatus Tisiphia endosymbiont of Nemotelus uliginosus TaxID=3077926 RepID=UPI001D2EA6D7|nr:hypothetical protein [Rickettsia endosymbiont of Sericostoma sp.]